ncbi:MAG: hypothetical protein N2111_03060 [Candidatus Sumerlaeaceae bacterium]|nr:hypothetical protein [Candidatus Sumerlaeaceae bacterium]
MPFHRQAGIVVAVAIAAHFMILSRGLVWDDPMIRDHMRLTGLWRIFQPDYFGFVRPGKVALFSIAASLFGSWAPGWQALSLLILIAASLALLRFAREFLPPAGALAAALAYAAHPLHVEATGWFSAVNGTALVAFAFPYYLIMLRLAQTARWHVKDLLLATACLAGALFMKEDAVVTPFVALLCIVARCGRVERPMGVVWMVHLGLALAFTAYNRLAARDWGQELIPPIYPEWVLSLHAARSFFEHVVYFAAPFRWMYYIEYDRRPTVLLPMTLAGLLGAAALVAWLVRRPRRLDLPRLSVLMTIVPMLPVLNIIYTGNNLFGVRYLAHGGTGLALLAGWAVTEAMMRGGLAWRITRVAALSWLAGAIAASNVFHAGWRTDASLFGNIARAVPWHPYAWTMLARDAYNAGHYKAAEGYAREALRTADELDNLMLRETDRMKRLGLAAVAPNCVESYDPSMHVILAMSLNKQGRHDEALRALRTAAANGARKPSVLVNLAYHYDNDYFATRNPRSKALAIRYYTRAARSNRAEGETAFVNLGLLYAADGQTTQAVEVWTRGLKRFPGSNDIRHNLQIALRELATSAPLSHP